MYEDLIGHKLNRWTILDVYLKPKPNGNGGYYYAKCVCECGIEKDVLVSSLKSGQSKSCGCLQREVAKQGIIDLTGKKFGRLLVLRRNGKTKHGDPLWETRCECGTEKLISGTSLREGRIRSCGCWNAELVKERGIKNTKDLTGRRFGRLVVLNKTDKRDNSGRVIYRCRCDCGIEKDILGYSLRKGAIVSCGCVGRENRIKSNTTHGLSKTLEYRRYIANKRREQDSQWTVEMEIVLRDLQRECVICGSRDELTTDHVLPFSKGYSLQPGNCVILCKSCNSKKSNKLLSELPLEWQANIIWSAFAFKNHWDSRELEYREISSNG